MKTAALKDELFDAQFVRALAYTADGAAQLGECLQTARRITTTSNDLWYQQWAATAGRVEKAAEAASEAGHPDSARQAFFRASNYYRTAGLFLMGAPVDDRLRRSHDKQTQMFRDGAALLPLPPEIINIPYQDTTLPGYFFRAATDDTPRPTVVLTDGYDGTVEELYFAAGAAALSRGYHVVAFDGPGQGSVILEQGLVLRPDWENVITPVIDYALTRPEIDGSRVALWGWSFGGYTAPRAATAEHRIAACISDCGPYDLYDATVARIPGPLARQLPDGNPLALTVLGKAMRSLMKKPTAGWALRRNLWVHGVRDPMEFLKIAPQYTLKGREHLIRCPTFISSTDGDDLSSTAAQFAAKLICPSTYIAFGQQQNITGHCEMTGRQIFLDTVLDWLDRTLQNTPQPPESLWRQ